MVDVSAAEEAVLTGPARPIVLLARRSGSPLSDLVAPGNPYVGVAPALHPPAPSAFPACAWL